jgi:YidC/Oxa1 family membrane protein insertase
VGDFGLAIIIFTIIVKFAMWPLVKKQLHQTRLMKKIQPELTEIKKNCKGNRQLESLQMMDLYKRNNIKPFRSFLTILVQLPIFIALFTAIRVTVSDPTPEMSVEKSAYSFVEPLPRIQSIIENHDSFTPRLLGLIDLSATAGFTSISAIFILVFALAAALTQYILARQQMPSKKTKKRTFRQIMKDAAAGKQADQSELNTVVSGQMTKFMPIMMLFVMLSLPGALVFYYLLSNLVTVVQQKMILARYFSEMEQAADKKVIKELHDIKEAEIVSKPKNKNQKITRIKASSKKRRK